MQGRDLLLIISVMAIWGFNFSMIKLGVSEMDPLLIAAARFFCATFPIIFFVRKPNVQWRYLMAYGLVFGTGIWGMASCSITFGLSSGMASVLLQTDVLTTVLVGVLLYKEVISARMAAGIVVSVVGLVVSIIYTNGNVTLAGVVFIMISAICWPLAGVIVRKSGTRSAFAFNIWGMLFAPLPLVALSVGMNGWDVLSTTYQQWNSNAWISVLFQAYPTTVFGYWVWNKMVLKYPMSQLAPMTLLVSVFALLSGYAIYDEQLSLAQWVSCSTFLLGIGLVLYPQSKKQPAFEKRTVSTPTSV
ncbi:EamA family transporter [Vibrio fluvialis]|uniref:Permease of the drug/metabolite transporter (DMT) superfamily n=1 Tax=Vibrio fluvialis PG41 TaxID=1336752 RepID=S7I745_VIBFL|nr:EamA family transporter [Vibrio fluvialis]EKO3416531.1 EamA family transporter [Vibrio fluvialis]EKO3435718.1 EamA family transporter [Vibrio fluvialis]EKO3485697.1 EamA family transporter [Vibrio fluvialis]EKO3941462.1 EamA family transporter [Vibrio fluvialis]EKO5122869.1 EamA family transporter [Vibrio fluvialis]